MYDAIYDRDALTAIKERFPDVVWKDASDPVHPHRITVIVDCTEEDWWRFCIESGVGAVSLNFQIASLDAEKSKRILELLKEATDGN